MAISIPFYVKNRFEIRTIMSGIQATVQFKIWTEICQKFELFFLAL
jgi:hypothetical protein